MLGDRERSRPVAEVARSFLQVDRDRIVDQRPNIALSEVFHQSIALRSLYDETMVDCMFVRGELRQHHFRCLYSFIIKFRIRPPLGDHGIQFVEPITKQRGLEHVHSKVKAPLQALIAVDQAMVTQAPRAAGMFSVLEYDKPGISRRIQILKRVTRKRGSSSPPLDRSVAVSRTDCLRRVLDDGEPMALRDASSASMSAGRPVN